MSDERRKQARTQGRFSDENRTKKEKSKQKNGAVKPPKSSSAEPSLQYQENSSYSFSELEDKKKPIEIKESGFKILSGKDDTESRVYFDPEFISKDMASEWMGELHKTIKWDDQDIVIHGEKVAQPRLIAWFGPFPYSYSGVVLESAEMPPLVRLIKDQVEQHMSAAGFKDVCINSVLLNLYRNGKDSVAWHSDDELSMGVMPTIASVSLGEVRKFEMKPKQHVEDVDSELRYFVNLTPGSLLVMDGNMQNDWLHQVPKEYHDREPRINLTFRTVYSKHDASRFVTVPSSKTTDSVKETVKTSHVPTPLTASLSEFPCLGNDTSKSAIPLSAIDSQKNSDEDITNSEPEENNEESQSVEDDGLENEVLHQTVNDGDLQNEVLHQTVNDGDLQNEGLHPTVEDGDLQNEVLHPTVEDGELQKENEDDDLQLTNQPIQDGDLHQPDVNGEDPPTEDDILHQPVTDDIKVKESNVKLNANAPAFVPQISLNRWSHYDLEQYTRIHVDRLDQSEMADLYHALTEYVRREQMSFTARNWFELSTYLRLASCDLNDEAKRIMNERIVELFKKELTPYVPKRYSTRDRRYR